MPFEEKRTTHKILPQMDIFFVADIGGTKSRFCFLQKKNKGFAPLIFFYFKTQNIAKKVLFDQAVLDVLGRFKKLYNRTPAKACFALAGVIDEKRRYGSLTNQPLEFDVDHLELLIQKPVSLINDFEALAWGLDVLSTKDFVSIIKPSKRISYKLPPTKALLGAGTGLGKSLLVWEPHLKHFIPFASEGGHADFPAQNQLEYKLVRFIKKIKKLPADHSLAWEDVLSGRGLQNIYLFLGKYKRYQQKTAAHQIKENNYDPHLITSNYKIDKQCRDATTLFIKFFGRCAKNFALETLSFGGIYLAGGIAAGNVLLFENKSFSQEFLLHKKFKSFLGQIPIFVITNEHAGLMGAAAYCQFLQTS